MEWYWAVLTAVLKLGLAFGPTAIRKGEFNFTDGQRAEAMDFAGVVACRTMLITTPVVLAITTIGKSEKLCANHAVTLLPIVLGGLLLLLFGIFAFSVDARRFRGRIAPFVVALVLAAVETGYTEFFSQPAAEKMCVSQVAALPGTVTSTTPGSGPSSK